MAKVAVKTQTNSGLPVIDGPMLDANLRYVANFRPEEMLIAGDITRQQFDKLIGNEHWTSLERRAMEDVLHRIVYAASYTAGLTAMVLPAEFIAHVIAIYVHPVNHQVASQFFQEPPSLDSLRNMDTVDASACDRVPREKLFAWVYTIYTSTRS